MILAPSAFATVSPGLLGYEGQPGNQGDQVSPGLLGYEGQPGNQGGLPPGALISNLLPMQHPDVGG